MSERAWLVEWRFNGVQWLYLWPSAPGGFSFTNDASKALRFARREDAEAALQWARDTDAARRPIGSLTRHGLALGEMLVTEHDWPALTAAPSAQPTTREGCDYIAPLGSLCRKCGHVHGQRYTFWTGDGEAAMQPDPNDNWLWIGDPAKAPKGL